MILLINWIRDCLLIFMFVGEYPWLVAVDKTRIRTDVLYLVLNRLKTIKIVIAGDKNYARVTFFQL